MSYVICTDSCCDLSPAYIDSHKLPVLSVPYIMNGETLLDDNYRTFSPVQFYNELRAGVLPQTTLANSSSYADFFSTMLEAGQDVLYLCFSSGLSGCFQASRLAADQLKETFPQRRLILVDTLAASMGQGLLVHYALANQASGMTLEENAAWVEEHKLNLAHWFTVDDLNHLRRGGRISMSTAILGTVLSIKPIMHMDDEGHLVAVDKARGRKQSLKALVEQMGRLVIHPEKQDIFISHSDCPADARYVADLIEQRFQVKSIQIHEIGPVIGSHTGPNVVSLFFMGEHR